MQWDFLIWEDSDFKTVPTDVAYFQLLSRNANDGSHFQTDLKLNDYKK